MAINSDILISFFILKHLVFNGAWVLTLHSSHIRESRKSVGKKEEKKRKSAGGDKDRERGNDSFKSREFIETSEESSSDSDRKSKSKRKKVKSR